MSDYDPFSRGPHPVGVRDATWTDEARERTLPISIWYPERDMGELEPIGPAENLSPGQRASFTEEWWLLPYEFPGDSKSIDFPSIREQVRRNNGPVLFGLGGRKVACLLLASAHQHSEIDADQNRRDNERIEYDVHHGHQP